MLFTVLGLCNGGHALDLSPPKAIDLPQLDYGRLGDVVLAGGFDGLTQLAYAGQSEMLEPPSRMSDDLVVQYDAQTFLQQDFLNGRVHTSCLLGDNVTAVIAGNFTSVFNSTVDAGLAAVDFENQTVVNLGKSVNGSEVRALWCNSSSVYVGGSFQYGGSSGVAVWHQQNASWSLPAFGGFADHASINTIVEHEGNIVFGGNFSGLSFSAAVNSSQNASRLLKPGMQPVSFALAKAEGFATAGASAEDASSLLCPLAASSGWTGALDSATGYVNVTLAYIAQPTKIRLFNLADGSGTKSFRIISEPAGSFMNLTYVDGQGARQSCAAACPLPEYNDTIRHTEFEFVNVVPTASLRVEMLDFYGDHAGLKGLQLFEAGQYAFANNAYNNPRNCNTSDADSTDVQGATSATARLAGGTEWRAVRDFMATNVTDKSKFSSTYAQFEPNLESYVVDKGLYEVLLYTPGCRAFGNCLNRGQVNITTYPGYGSPQSTVLYQTNEDLKYDLVFNGTLQQGAYIRITPTEINQVPMNLVAYKVSFNYLGRQNASNASTIFEFSERNFTSAATRNAVPVGGTALNTLGKRLGANACVGALMKNGSSQILIGGRGFPSNVSESTNLISLNLSRVSVTGLTGVPQNESVSALLSAGTGTHLGVTSDEVYRLESGRASTTELGSTAAVAPFMYKGSSYLAFSTRASDNQSIAFWNESSRSVVPPGELPIAGHISASLAYKNVTLYVGSLQIADDASSGAAVLSESSSVFSPALALKARKVSTQILQRRAESTRGADHDLEEVRGGVYTNASSFLLFGKFNATTSDNVTAVNALVVDGNRTRRFLDEDFSFTKGGALSVAAVSNITVALGGRFEGKVREADVQGVILAANGTGANSLPTQPAPLNPGQDVDVRALVFKPNTSDILVGGNFSSADGTSNATCHGACLLADGKWVQPAGLSLEPESVISDLVFETGDQVLLGGSISTSTGSGQVATYNFSSSELAILPALPGPASKLLVISNSTTDPVYAAAGTANSTASYLQWFDGSSRKWEAVPNSPLRARSNITALSLVILDSTATSSSSEGGPFSPQRALLVSGALDLGSEQASVLLYDGTAWTPLFGTTGRPGQSGTVSSVFAQYGGDLKGGARYSESTRQPHARPPSPPPSRGRGTMRTGHVVGIACAIGIGCVLLLMILYILTELALDAMSCGVAYQNLSQTKPDTDAMMGTKIVR